MLAFTSAPIAGQHPTPSPPQPRQSPNAPTNQNVPGGLEGVPTSVETRKVPINEQNERELRANVQRLYMMVSELKDEVNKTNANTVLSVSLLKRAQEIEKLAKQIKNQAKQ
jgi:hypothetical protein